MKLIFAGAMFLSTLGLGATLAEDDALLSLRNSAIEERELNEAAAAAAYNEPDLNINVGLATPLLPNRLGVGVALDILYADRKADEIYGGCFVGLSQFSDDHHLVLVMPTIAYQPSIYSKIHPVIGVGAGLASEKGKEKFAFLLKPGVLLGRSNAKTAIETAIGFIGSEVLFIPRLSISI